MKEIIPSSLPAKTSKNSGKDILNDSGLSLEQCAREMKNLLHYAEEDSIKMKVIDTALKIHGVLQPEGARDQDIQIQFVFQSESEAVGMQILIPR